MHFNVHGIINLLPMKNLKYAAVGLMLSGCGGDMDEVLTEPGRRTYNIVSDGASENADGTETDTKPLGDDDIEMTECSARQPRTSTEGVREEEIGGLRIRQKQRVTCLYRPEEGDSPESQTLLFITDQMCHGSAGSMANVVRTFQYNDQDPTINGLQSTSIPTYVGSDGRVSLESCLAEGCSSRNYTDWGVEMPAHKPKVRDWIMGDIDPTDCKNILQKDKFPKGLL